MKQRIATAFTEADRQALQELDNNYLKFQGDGRRNYVVRWQLFERSFADTQKKDSDPDPIGKDWAKVYAVKQDVDSIRKALDDAGKNFGIEFKACSYYLDVAFDSRQDSLVLNYIQQAKDQISSRISFPLVWSPEQSLGSAGMERANTLLQRLKSDLTSQKFEGLTSQYKPRLKLLTEKLSPVQHMGEMMSDNNFNFTVYLVNYNDQEDKSGLDEWRFVRAGGALESTNTPNNIRIGSCGVNDSVTLEFRRYENESPFRRSLSPFSIMMGKGRATRFNINVGGKPITVAVETDTPVPGEANWPKKNDLINSLQ